MKIDYLIVGQGLAGSIIADRLIILNKSIIVIDDVNLPSSSNIAAGLFNPVTGRKMVKTWNADRLFPELINYYQDLESRLNSKFFYLKTIYRPFRNAEEQNDWIGKSADVDMKPFIKKYHTQPTHSRVVFDEFGGLELNLSGYVDIEVLLRKFREYLEKKELLRNEKYIADELIIGNDEIIYNGIRAKKIIFTKGQFEADSGLFDWLPFRRVKGEILEIEANINSDIIYNRGVFLIPLENGRYKVGSTYDWQDLSWDVTFEARQDIEVRLKTLLRTSYQITNQYAGVRPATKDRKPFIGMHPKYENALIFNGFGTKGVSLIPYFSKKLCEYLEEGIDLPPEANISRYFSLY